MAPLAISSLMSCAFCLSHFAPPFKNRTDTPVAVRSTAISAIRMRVASSNSSLLLFFIDALLSDGCQRGSNIFCLTL
ncbi:hypothetical protein BDW60DRAFT_200470 [Aspergillus nidulans var. acristatus]